MLNVNLIFLFIEWSREVLLEAWIQDAVSCCEKSGVTPPANLDDSTNAGDHELNIMKAITSKKNFEEISVSVYLLFIYLL